MVGVTGPIGSGLPQFGFPRRFAMDYCLSTLGNKSYKNRSNYMILGRCFGIPRMYERCSGQSSTVATAEVRKLVWKPHILRTSCRQVNGNLRGPARGFRCKTKKNKGFVECQENGNRVESRRLQVLATF